MALLRQRARHAKGGNDAVLDAAAPDPVTPASIGPGANLSGESQRYTE